MLDFHGRLNSDSTHLSQSRVKFDSRLMSRAQPWWGVKLQRTYLTPNIVILHTYMLYVYVCRFVYIPPSEDQILHELPSLYLCICVNSIYISPWLTRVFMLILFRGLSILGQPAAPAARSAPSRGRVRCGSLSCRTDRHRSHSAVINDYRSSRVRFSAPIPSHPVKLDPNPFHPKKSKPNGTVAPIHIKVTTCLLHC